MVHSCRSVQQQELDSLADRLHSAKLAEVAAALETQLMEQPAPTHVLQHSLTTIEAVPDSVSADPHLKAHVCY